MRRMVSWFESYRDQIPKYKLKFTLSSSAICSIHGIIALNYTETRYLPVKLHEECSKCVSQCLQHAYKRPYVSFDLYRDRTSSGQTPQNLYILDYVCQCVLQHARQRWYASFEFHRETRHLPVKLHEVCLSSSAIRGANDHILDLNSNETRYLPVELHEVS